MFRFMVCDGDEAFCRKEKRLIYEFFRDRKVRAEIDIFHTAEEILALGEKVSAYRAIFLEVSAEGAGGMDLAGWLSAAAPELIIVFVSDDMSCALDGYKVGAIRYIIKDEERFLHSMEECFLYILQKSQQEDDNHYIFITDEKIRVSVDRVLYVESNAHKITYHLMKNSDTEQEYTVYGKLGDAERELQGFGFCRVHQSYLVNMNYVREVMRYKVVLLNGTEIQVSKKNYKTAEEQFVRIRGTF